MRSKTSFIRLLRLDYCLIMDLWFDTDTKIVGQRKDTLVTNDAACHCCTSDDNQINLIKITITNLTLYNIQSQIDAMSPMTSLLRVASFVWVRFFNRRSRSSRVSLIHKHKLHGTHLGFSAPIPFSLVSAA